MKRIQKPIVISVLTILIVALYGIAPFLTAFPVLGRRFIFGALPFNGSITMLYGSDGEASFILVFISLFLCAFSVASSIWAYYGYNEGRIATLAFVSTNFLWWTFLVIIAIVDTPTDSKGYIALFTSLIFPPIWLGFIWWQYTRPDVLAYYRRTE
jgi:hypothetical protein